MGKDEVVLEEVKAWVEEFVSRRNPFLGNFPPCPFARKAILARKVFWKVCGSGRAAVEAAIEECAVLVAEGLFEVAVVIDCEPAAWQISELDRFVTGWRYENEKRDLFLLRDHPADPELINNVKMNQGSQLLFFLQKKSALDAARKELRSAGYYASWPEGHAKMMLGGLDA